MRPRVKQRLSLLLATLPLAILICAPAHAQDAEASTPAPPSSLAPKTESIDVDFVADQLDYDQDADIVTASGSVQMVRTPNKLRAGRVIWNRKTGEVRAEGNVVISNPQGDNAYGDSVVLTESLKDGVVENLLIVLNDGGRLVAERGTRNNGVSELERAVFSPCRVVDDQGCPKDPVWKITALRVTHDPIKNRISYKGARFELFGLPILALPGLSHPADLKGGTGLLVPDARYSQANGLELSVPYYAVLDRNRDLTITPHVFTKVLPAIEAKYRALTGNGAYQVGGYATYGSRFSGNALTSTRQKDFRGYFEANGKFQINPLWSVTGAVRVASDRTFLQRYDISRDDRLRSVIEVERVTPSSYLSISGWAFQTLRTLDRQGQIPIALPILDFRKRLSDPWLGGRIELQLNSVALTRTSGQDTQRAFAGARWDLRRITNGGQELLLTGYARADVYHSDQIELTSTLPYRGTSGWNARAIAAAAAEVRWPLVGSFLKGTQRLTPRVQLVASPGISNLKVPNEDARAVDLEDSNLFALNRFPGYDRFESGPRITYGVDWAYDAPGLSVQANIGQSYRLNSRRDVLPDGTGLSDRLSDIVGRTTVKFRRYVRLTHRYRLDKNNFSVRRNEADITVGTSKNYAIVGYLRLNRNIGPTLEDLQDREEIRLGGRVQLARYWSIFGSAIVDLTGRREDPTTTADGFQPVRHRVGIAYDDDCLSLGLTWRRDYDGLGDARRGNTFQIRLSLKHLGR